MAPAIAVTFWLVGDATFPERLKRLRLKRGLTQKQLSDAAGVSRDLVYRWERGYHGAQPRTGRQVAAVLEVEAGYLVGDGPEIAIYGCARRPRCSRTDST